jgi:hypothetical protein
MTPGCLTKPGQLVFIVVLRVTDRLGNPDGKEPWLTSTNGT